jgi:hypothetical protein
MTGTFPAEDVLWDAADEWKGVSRVEWRLEVKGLLEYSAVDKVVLISKDSVLTAKLQYESGVRSRTVDERFIWMTSPVYIGGGGCLAISKPLKV